MHTQVPEVLTMRARTFDRVIETCIDRGGRKKAGGTGVIRGPLAAVALLLREQVAR